MDTPLAMPPQFWCDSSIQAALSRRHMGALIAAYRHHPHHRRPLRQADVAAWAGISQVQLSRIENGPPPQHLDRLIFWARLLCIPAALLWFQMPTAPATPARTPPIRLPEGGAFRLVQIGEGTALDAVHAFRSLDSARGGGHLYQAILDYLHDRLAPHLFDSDDTDSAFAAAAGLTEMAGWTAHDAGNDEQGRRHCLAALKLAGVGRDPQLCAHVLASLAHLALHAGYPDLALRHAYEGESALARGPRHPELSARLYAMQARAAAAQHRPRDSRALLDRAGTALTTSTGEPPLSPWVSRFDEASLASETLRCLRDLGDHRSAVPHAERILELRPADRARARAFAQLALAEVLIDLHDLEHACTLTTTVATNADPGSSYLVLARLTDLGRALQPHRSVTVVRDTLDTLDSVIALRERAWKPPHANHLHSGR